MGRTIGLKKSNHTMMIGSFKHWIPFVAEIQFMELVSTYLHFNQRSTKLALRLEKPSPIWSIYVRKVNAPGKIKRENGCIIRHFSRYGVVGRSSHYQVDTLGAENTLLMYLISGLRKDTIS